MEQKTWLGARLHRRLQHCSIHTCWSCWATSLVDTCPLSEGQSLPPCKLLF